MVLGGHLLSECNGYDGYRSILKNQMNKKGEILMNIEYEELILSINKIEEMIVKFENQASRKHIVPIEWMTLADGAKYAGVSYNSFSKFREMGLKVSQVEGIKRVSRTEIDKFLEKNSF